MKKPTCTFSYCGLPYNVHVGFFHSYLKETKKIQLSILNEIAVNANFHFSYYKSMT